MEFQGKIVVVTGAAAGIGQALAREYAHQGARVVLADINLAPQESTVVELRRSGLEAYAYEVDVSSDEQVTEFAASVLRDVGVPWVIHNNAAITWSGSIVDIEIEDLRQQIDVNVFGYLRVTNAFLPSMIDRGSGQIAITASPNGINPPPMVAANLAAYCLSKAANVSMAQCLAVTLKPLGIAVSLLFPDLTNTHQGRQFTGKASTEFHQMLAHIMSNATAADNVAKRLIEGIKVGKFFVNAMPGYEAALLEWAKNELDPHRDWVGENTPRLMKSRLGQV
ncbi:uncharacterized protein A1O9_07114 [Exophiala aquamarina CBS 119918]|uniref:Alcohol dehydrogenase n=1 Tax=Exophiala aquamarina CBS 119918 TaxID=1182545 RepID=A0A072P9Y8_9EURO|nr:uncharacterized protein A1O9_07114 [Exophiala aquamarina CBS 119918]KEF56924.1 hypothetical protein A1O9_07114 [Exophiala aquamarina CBS 119918]